MMVGNGRSTAQRPSTVYATSALLAVLAVAFVLRLHALDREELGLDGFLSVGLAREQWPVFTNFQLRDPHPPLYYVALRGWLALSGTTFETARWLSIASGLVSIALLARIARHLAGPSSGVLIALLFSLAPAHLYTTASVRDFAPGLTLSLVALWLYPIRARGQHWERRGILALALATSAATLTWYFHIVIIAMQVAVALFFRTRRDIWVGLGSGLLLTVPWLALSLPHLLPQLFNEASHVRYEVPPEDFARWVTEASIGVWPALPWQSNMVIFTGLTALSWLALARRRRWLTLFLATFGSALALLVTFMVVTRWWGPALIERYVSLALPFLLLGPSTGVIYFFGPTRGMATAALLLFAVPMLGSYRALAALESISYSTQPSFVYLREHLHKEDAVLFTDVAWRGIYELAAVGPAPAYTAHYVGTHYFPDELESSLTVLRPALQQAQQIWLVNNLPDDPSRLSAEALVMERLLDILPLRQVTTMETALSTIRISRYGPGPPPPPVAIEAVFGGSYLLRTAALPVEAGAGETLAIILSWEALAVQPANYAVFVHLRDATERTVAQGDSEPRLGSWPTTKWRTGERVSDPHVIPLPPDLAPGTYHVVAGLYDENARLPVASGGNEAMLGQVQIE